MFFRWRRETEKRLSELSAQIFMQESMNESAFEVFSRRSAELVEIEDE